MGHQMKENNRNINKQQSLPEIVQVLAPCIAQISNYKVSEKFYIK